MKMIIDGKAVDSSDGKVLNVLNPATGQVIDTVPSATEDDVNKAVSCAKEAQKIWAKVPVYEKVEILKKFINLVLENKEDLARTLSNETGKPIKEARAEIANIPIAFDAFSEKAKHLYGTVVPAGLELDKIKIYYLLKGNQLV